MVGRCLVLAAIALFLLLGGTAHATPVHSDTVQVDVSQDSADCDEPKSSGACCSLFCLTPAAIPSDDLPVLAAPRVRFASVALGAAPVATPQPEPSPPRRSS